MIAVKVTVLAHPLRVMKLFLVFAAGSLLLSSILMVAVLAHTVCIVLEACVLALADDLAVLREKVLLFGHTIDSLYQKHQLLCRCLGDFFARRMQSILGAVEVC